MVMEQSIDNPLYGMHCPNCDNSESFEIMAHTLVCMTPQGYTNDIDSFQWDGNSFCKCSKCGWISIVDMFYPIFLDDDEDYSEFNEEDYD
jgi:hypothetical protein